MPAAASFPFGVGEHIVRKAALGGREGAVGRPSQIDAAEHAAAVQIERQQLPRSQLLLHGERRNDRNAQPALHRGLHVLRRVDFRHGVQAVGGDAAAAEVPADGTYTCAVTLEGGSGRATVDSPAALTVVDGAMTATIVWSSPNYDYMLIDGEKYLPTNTEGNSTFEIPVAALDTALAVTADTVAMSTPHEIDYTLTLDSTTLAAAE